MGIAGVEGVALPGVAAKISPVLAARRGHAAWSKILEITCETICICVIFSTEHMGCFSLNALVVPTHRLEFFQGEAVFHLCTMLARLEH